MARTRFRLLPLAAALLACACAGNPAGPSPESSPPPSASGGPPDARDRPAEVSPEANPEPSPGREPAPPTRPGRAMPDFAPSGIREEWRKVAALKGAGRSARTAEERAAAAGALADWVAEFPARWSGKEVPAPEAYVYALVLRECRDHRGAVAQARRWLEVAPEDNVNHVHATTLLITCLAESGDLDAASAELDRAVPAAYAGREAERRGAEEAIAVALMRAGRLEEAAGRFEALATRGPGDVEAAIHGADCWLRAGRAEEALRLAGRAADHIREGRPGERARILADQVALVGRPAPGFAAARWWRGEGGPVADDMLKGPVTVVFAWNMQRPWIPSFFDRLNAMIAEYEGKDVRFVGISRLARFDPVGMATRDELTDDEELRFYDMWSRQYRVTYPLAIGGPGDTALVDAWVARVIPYFVVVGRDGVVAYVRTGREEEHFRALGEMVDRALAR